MTYVDIFAKFLEMFPSYQEKVYSWKGLVGHTIDITLKDSQMLTFTYYNNNEWSLRTYGQYM